MPLQAPARLPSPMTHPLKIAPELHVRIYFRGKPCGLVELDLKTIRRLVNEDVSTHLQEAAGDDAASAVAAGPKVVRDMAFRCFEHAMHCAHTVGTNLVSDAVSDWYISGSDELILSQIKSGDINWGSPALAAFRKRIAESGTSAERRKLATALRQGFAGVRKGRIPNLRSADPDWLRILLPTIERAVKAARHRSSPDHTLLTPILKAATGGRHYMHLRQRVRAATRHHLAVELVVAALSGVPRDEARRAIRQARSLKRDEK